MLQRVLYLVVTIAVGWAVYFFLLSRLARGPEQAWVFLPVWLILAYALLPLTHVVLISRSIALNTAGPALLLSLGWILVVTALLLVVAVNLMKKRLIV